jgi:Transposase DDE domain
LESHHVSRHFLARAGRMKQFRRFPKLTLVSHHASYLIAALQVRYGPCNDAPDFIPAVTQAVRCLPIHRLFGDGAYDAEAHHRVCREEFGIASTVIPINPRGPRACRPTGPHRRRMFDRFPRRLYGRRWHAESTISQHKRRLGSAMTARTPRTRECECMLRITTHDLMILRCAS